MVDEMRKAIKAPHLLIEVDCHINDEAVATAAMSILDDWISRKGSYETAHSTYKPK